MDDLFDFTNMGTVGEEEQTRSQAPDVENDLMFPYISQESPILTFTNSNTLCIPTPRRIPLICATRRDHTFKIDSVRVYGAKMNPRMDSVVDKDMFRIEYSRGFCGIPGKKRIGGRITMNIEPQIPKDKTFVIHLFVDVSGSMSGSIGISHKSRIDIVNDAIEQMRATLRPVVEKGLKVKLSLHTFSKECKECVPVVDATVDYLETMDWREHIKTYSMTNIWGAVRAAQQMRRGEETVDKHHTYIIVSDGEDTCHESQPDGDIKVFDYAIGVGTSEDYDPTILSQITKNEIEGCPNEQSLSATLLRLGCADYMVMAKDVAIRVNGKLYEVQQWLCGSQVLFTLDVAQSEELMNFTYCFTKSNGGVIAASMMVDISGLPQRCGMEQRRMVELCGLNEESGEILRGFDSTMWSQKDSKLIRVMYVRCKTMMERFDNESWAYLVAAGLENTWRTLNQNSSLPSMDRGFSIQSAIRQTSANYYDCQTMMNCSNYSQSAF